jgi:hypothetical protein
VYIIWVDLHKFSSLNLIAIFEFFGIHRGVAVDSALGYNTGVSGDNWILMF